VVGGAATLRRAIVSVAGLILAAAVAAPATGWTVDAGCRDGRPQGPYQLRSDNGQLRVAGAFNEGTPTGSFIFWRANGVREAHIPYNHGTRNGTVATWYDGAPGREPPRHLESVWRHGVRDGQTRTWYEDGHRRSETEYAGGRIVRSIGWTRAGERLADDAARALAERDEQAADVEYGQRDALIRDHPASCARAGSRV
jgi:hypothetical protein